MKLGRYTEHFGYHFLWLLHNFLHRFLCFFAWLEFLGSRSELTALSSDSDFVGVFTVCVVIEEFIKFLPL
jgi:hypothetical protein